MSSRTAAALLVAASDVYCGRYLYNNGSTFVGQFMGGAAHGLGVFVSASGERYIGEWAGDKFHGNGIYKFHAGSTYAVSALLPKNDLAHVSRGRARGSLEKWTGTGCTRTCKAASASARAAAALRAA